MGWIDDLIDGLVTKAATSVEPGFARFLEKSKLQERNAQLYRQALKEEAKLLGRRVTGAEAMNDVKMAFNSATGRSTPEQEQQFLQKTPKDIGLDFLGVVPGVLAATPKAASGFAQLLRRPGIARELVKTGPSQFEVQNIVRPGTGPFRFMPQQPAIQRALTQGRNRLGQFDILK